MKRLLLGLMLAMTASAASAKWTGVDYDDELITYVDRATIRRSGNFVKMWDLMDNKTAQNSNYAVGNSYFSDKIQFEFDCKEERARTLAITWFDGQMGSGKVVHNTSETSLKWQPIRPESMGETLWKIACGK